MEAAVMARSRMADKIARLKFASFDVWYADPAEGHRFGHVSSVSLSKYPLSDADRPYVMLSAVAADEDRAGQVDTARRSNYRRLRQDFPGRFVDVSFADGDALGAFVHDMTDDMVDVVVGLSVDYPLYDESDLSELESEEIGDAFDAYLWWDHRSELSEETQQVAELFTQEEIREAFYSRMSDRDYYPEHNGMDVLWHNENVRSLLTEAIEGLASQLSVSAPAEPIPGL